MCARVCARVCRGGGMWVWVCVKNQSKRISEQETPKGNGKDLKKDFKDSCDGPFGPDWVLLIFINPNTSL